MENASKALLMAGGIFLALVILAIGIGLFVGYRNVVETYDEKMSTSEITEINKQFEKFIKRQDITIQEIVTADKIANNFNNSHSNGEKLIEVKIDNSYVISRNSTDTIDKIQEKYISKIKSNIDNKYKVSIQYYGSDSVYSGIIHTVNFIKVN